MDGRPRLVELSQCPIPGTRPNVLVVGGLPWYASETQVAQYLQQAFPAAAPVTTRLYEDPLNGVSRGLCFVEYPAPPPVGAAASSSSSLAAAKAPAAAVDLEAVKAAVESTLYEQELPLTGQLYFMTAATTRWDRAGRLPDLPSDPPPIRRGEQMGYGDEGFVVRCGPALGLPNTATPSGATKLRALRKRLRAAAVRRGGSSSSSRSGSSDEEDN